MSEPTMDQTPRPEDDEPTEEPGYTSIEPTGSGLNVRRIAISLVIILAIVGVIYYLDNSRGSAVGASTAINVAGSGPAPQVGNPAPDFSLPGLDGQTVKLSDFKGTPVWINFWASWCPPCRAELPDVQAAYDQRKPQGLVLLAISISEDAPTVKQFAELNKMTSTVLLDTDETVASRYRINGIPTHIFVDKDGIIRDLVVGGLNSNTIFARLDKIQLR